MSTYKNSSSMNFGEDPDYNITVETVDGNDVLFEDLKTASCFPPLSRCISGINERTGSGKITAMVAVVVLATLTISLFVAAALLAPSDPAGVYPNAPPFVSPEGAQTKDFVVGPVHLMQGRMNMSEFFIETPIPGSIAIHRLSFEIIDQFNRTVPLEHVYNHHNFLGFMNAKNDWDSFRLIAGFGAEGVHTPVELPLGYGIVIPAGAQWVAALHLIDVIGWPGTYDQEIYMKYSATFTTYEESSPLTAVSCGIVGIMDSDGDVEFPIPGGEAPGSTYMVSQTLTWPYPTAQVVYASGHLHIGSQWISAVEEPEEGGEVPEAAAGQGKSDLSRGSRRGARHEHEHMDYTMRPDELLKSYPIKDDFGFVVKATYGSPMVELKEGRKYSVHAAYDNSRNLQAVMALFQICLKFPENVDPFAWQVGDQAAQRSPTSQTSGKVGGNMRYALGRRA